MISESIAPALQIEDLSISFPNDTGGRVRAVDGVSLCVYPGQTVALVGESGCGKSVTALSVLGLLPTPPAKIESGSIRLTTNGRTVDTRTLSERALRRVRGGGSAMIFQEPMSSLNPVITIGEQVSEAIRLHRGVRGRAARRLAIEALTEVGIREASRRLGDYPHEFSGGMRQRVMIAMALACRPAVLLADEPTTALDVTIQAQILDLLERIQRERGLAILLITHDLGVVAQRAHAVSVMYGGRIVESARTQRLFDQPTHPYTKALLGAIPSMTQRRERLTTVSKATRDPAAFRGLPGLPEGAQAWWPTHEPPAESHGACVFIQSAPEHWVACWQAGSPANTADPSPDIPPRADQSHSE